MTREEREKAIDALKISAPVMAVTQEEFNDYIQTLNKIMNWLEQEPCEDSIVEWKKDFKGYVDSLSMPRDDYNGIMEYIDELPVTPQPCTDAISRQAVTEVLLKYAHSTEGKAFAEFLISQINDLPPVKPQYTDAEIQKMQDLESAEIQKAYEIGKAENPNKWIPVSERYPEDGQHILFSTKTGCVFEGRYSADTSAHNWLSYKDDTYAWNNVVTAWMPLPEPYKASPTGAERSEE